MVLGYSENECNQKKNTYEYFFILILFLRLLYVPDLKNRNYAY